MRGRVLLACLLLACLAGPALAEGFLTPLGPVAEAQRGHLLRVTALTMIAIVPVLIGAPLIYWRYRRGRGAAYAPDFSFSTPLEIAMWGVPVLIVGALGVWLWRSTLELDPYRPLGENPLRVQVVGLDWKWLFLYPDEGVASVGDLALPVGRPVTLELTSDTVMQSFMVPSLAGQIYVMPGMTTRLNLMADRPGSARGSNTQFNGEGFAGQRVTAEALSPDAWRDWVARARAAPPLTREAYARLARRGSEDDARAALDLADGPIALRLADPGLFAQVTGRYRDGAPVPPHAQPGAPGYRAVSAP